MDTLVNYGTNKTLIKMTPEQREVFDRYFCRIKDTYILIDTSTSLYITLCKFEVSRETDRVLEIKVKDTVIIMWKKVRHIHITVL
jgi:hypothetical protein